MSAIWGVVDLSGKEIDKALSSRMSKVPLRMSLYYPMAAV